VPTNERFDVLHNSAATQGLDDDDLVDLDVEVWDHKMAVNVDSGTTAHRPRHAMQKWEDMLRSRS